MSGKRDSGTGGVSRRSAIGWAMAGLFSVAGCAPREPLLVKRDLPSLVLPGREPIIEPVVEAPVVAPELRILDRGVWGARPTRANRDPMGRITCLTIHHSAMGVASEESISNVKAHLRLIQKSHQKNKHWADIGYHFLIDYNGRIWEGRPLKFQGAHVGGKDNRHNIGICLMGDYDLQKPSHAEIEALRSLVDFLMDEYRIAVGDVYTHREVAERKGHSTGCPGRNLQREVNVMRRRIAMSGFAR